MEKIIKKKTNWLTLFILCIYELFVLFFIFIWSYASIAEIFQNGDFSEFVIISILLVFLGLFILDLILWQVDGSEVITINDETLVIKKRGKLFPVKTILNLFEVERIYLKDYKTSICTLFAKNVGIRGGKICIDYLGRSLYIGQSLTDTEDSQHIEEMNKLLFEYKRNAKDSTVYDLQQNE